MIESILCHHCGAVVILITQRNSGKIELVCENHFDVNVGCVFEVVRRSQSDLCYKVDDTGQHAYDPQNSENIIISKTYKMVPLLWNVCQSAVCVKIP